MKRLTRWGVVMLFVVAGCGGGDDNNRNIQFERDVGNNDAADMSQSMPDAAADVGSMPDQNMPVDMMVDVGGVDMMNPACDPACEPGYECVNNVCELTSSCGSALDVGVLSVGSPISVQGSLVTEGVEDLEAACVGDGFTSGRDRVITFELDQQAEVDWAFDLTGQYDAVVELRSDCEDAMSALSCSDMETGSQVLPVGRYYLILDQKFGNAGTFGLTLTANPADCTAGDRICDAANPGTLRICQANNREVVADCPAECTNNACRGSACNLAILASAGGTFSGDAEAFLPGQLNFAGNTDCTDAGDAGTAIPTPGYEVVFYLPNLTAGEIVSIDAETNDSNINAIFIVEQCGDMNVCAAAYKLTEQPDWVVTSSGSYYVIIDKRSGTNNPFNYSVNVL